MSDYIKREDIIKNIKPIAEILGLGYQSDLATAIMKCKSADVIEHRRGEWVEIVKSPLTHTFVCSQCGRTVEDAESGALVLVRYPFCHCGADMRGDE